MKLSLFQFLVRNRHDSNRTKTYSNPRLGWKVHDLGEEPSLLHYLFWKQTEDEAEVACTEGGSEESHGMWQLQKLLILHG